MRNPHDSVTWEENVCFKMNVLPQKIINYHTPDFHNKTQGSKGGKVIGLENLISICDISNKRVKGNLFL